MRRVRCLLNAGPKVTALRCSILTAITQHFSRVSGPENPHSIGQTEERQHVSPTLREKINNYVDNGKFETLVGRSWDTRDEESKKDFKNFLYKHMRGIYLINSESH